MKTPHRIRLVRGSHPPSYNPVTDRYDQNKGQEDLVPCLVTFVSQARVFEAYGSRKERVMICRFQQVQEPFSYALYEGERYELMDQIHAPIKGAVRLRKAGV